jgi:ParB-like chromosome segregation protein Spo0J
MELEPRTTAPAHATGAVAFVPLAAIAGDVTFRLREEGDVAALAASIGRLGQLAPVELRPIPGAPPGGPRYQVVAGFRRLAALRLLARERVLARVHERLSDEDAWGVALTQALLAEPLDGDALRALRERLVASGLAPWAEDLWDEALVRAPVEPELRERFYDFLAGGPAESDAPPDEGSQADDGLEADAGDLPDELELEAAEGDAEAEATATEAEEEAVAEPPDDETGADVDVEVEVTPEELVADLAGRLYEVNADLVVAAEAWADLPAAGRLAILDQLRWIADLLPHLEGDDE